MSKRSLNLVHGAAVAALLATGCGGAPHYVRPNADFSSIKTVTVLPFDNVTNDKLAGERVQRIFVSELLNLGVFEVLEPGLANRLARRDSVEAATVGPEEIKKIGRELKVQGIFLGTLVEYDEGRTSGVQAPRVTIQLRLLETETGITMWSIQRTGGGASMMNRLFGVGGVSASDVAADVLRSQLKDLTF